jgi:hypothetical protein
VGVGFAHDAASLMRAHGIEGDTLYFQALINECVPCFGTLVIFSGVSAMLGAGKAHLAAIHINRADKNNTCKAHTNTHNPVWYADLDSPLISNSACRLRCCAATRDTDRDGCLLGPRCPPSLVDVGSAPLLT